MDIAPQAPKITERTFAFAVSVVRFCQKLVTKPGVNRTLGQQLLRAGTSIGANLEEAQAAQSSADFISKCSISLKEARETIYWPVAASNRPMRKRRLSPSRPGGGRNIAHHWRDHRQHKDEAKRQMTVALSYHPCFLILNFYFLTITSPANPHL